MIVRKVYKAVCSDCTTNPTNGGYELLIHYTSGFSGTVVLENRRTQQYYVVDMPSWRGRVSIPYLHSRLLIGYISMDEADQILTDALHQTAERFDTLEQAMLYFEMVRS